HLIRWLQRVPLGTPYPAVVEHLAKVAEAAKSWGSTTIVLDGTGVGAPVVDLMRRATSVPIRAIVFTAGDHERADGHDVARVPKRDLVSGLEVVLQERRLDVTPDCPLRAELEAELKAFDYSITDRGHSLFSARRGHDDMVMALCLALHHAGHRTGADAYIDWVDREEAGLTPWSTGEATGR
ncbi:MAG: hypothetical protein WBF51_06660, partial [Candidatus Dormiibacterota bacterium]